MATAVILAGGFGTRLQTVVNDVPKPMAPVGPHPFLHYVLLQLQRGGIAKVIMAVGYKHETIMKYFGNNYCNMEILYSIEHEPLGTGGAIKQALAMAEGTVLVVNGDTFFDIDIEKLTRQFQHTSADIAIALKRMYRFDRYGTVMVDDAQRITAFCEKAYKEEGFINGGLYVLDAQFFDGLALESKFSMERDVMEAQVHNRHMVGCVFDNYFIDIGIPEDYYRAQNEL